MTPRGRFITITLMAVLMPFAGPGTSVWAQSYTAPAGIPPRDRPRRADRRSRFSGDARGSSLIRE